MKTTKLTVTVPVPPTPRIGFSLETDKEMKSRVLMAHKKFQKAHSQIESNFKRKKISVKEYHAALSNLTQDQFGTNLVLSFRKVYLTLENQRKFCCFFLPF